MKRFALATAVCAGAIALAGSAQAAGAPITPHAYVARIAGAMPAVLNGTWRLTLTTHTFVVNKGGEAAVAGRVRIVGKRITFHDLGGPFACRGAQATGVYSWRVVGKRLSLTVVREPCAGRKTILTKRFTRVR